MCKHLFVKSYKRNVLYGIFLIVFIHYSAQKLYKTDVYYSVRNMFLDSEKICWNEQNFKSIEKQLLGLEVKS